MARVAPRPFRIDVGSDSTRLSKRNVASARVAALTAGCETASGSTTLCGGGTSVACAMVLTPAPPIDTRRATSVRLASGWTASS